jgi:hypothetical protein
MLKALALVALASGVWSVDLLPRSRSGFSGGSCNPIAF